MATTKIHAIKSTLGKAINYICNEKKTDEHVLISSFGCAPQTADLEFGFYLSKNKDGGPNLAYHLIQSFKPGEITGEEAHNISKELADRFLGGKYQYVLATHVDKAHIHSHIIFCAVNTETYMKYHGCTGNYYKIRDLSDEICAEHGKSVIKEFKGKGKSYTEWQHTKKGDSWKAKLKRDIDECINSSILYETFIDKMKERGYEITGETFGEGSAKYIAFRPLGKERFIRGRAQSLGEDYTKERIRERIDERIYHRAEQIVSESLSKKAQNSMYSDPYSTVMATKLIDTSSEKFAQSIGLTKWADKQNFKLIATMYADLDKFGVHSIAELGDKEHDLRIETHKAKKEVVNIEKEIKEYSEVLRYGEYYFKYKKYNSEYNALKPKARDKYYNTYYTQLGLYEAAVNVLKNHNIDPKTLSLKSINEHYNQLLEKKDTLYTTYRSMEAEHTTCKNTYDSLTSYLGISDKGQRTVRKRDDISL